MRTIRYLPAARRALLRHRNVAKRITRKIEQFAADPAAFSATVRPLKGRRESRLRIGDFRVLYLIEGDDLLIIDIGCPWQHLRLRLR